MNNFDPIERLVEFGLGISLARQMVSMLNNTMHDMYIPGQTIPSTTSCKEWYLAIDGKAHGPYTEASVRQKMLNKEVTKDTLVWCVGMTTWATAEQTPELLKLYLQIPPSLCK